MKDAEHLLRVAIVFVAGALAFLGIRAFFIPRSFGQYGHYRGAAIAEIAALPTAYAGHQACESCHTDVLEEKAKGKHTGVNCEACHGPQGRHANDISVIPVKPDPAVLCAQCHEASGAKPKWFPQVDTKDHSGGIVCNTCHNPHNPGFEGDSK
jgi:hypothetical protein